MKQRERVLNQYYTKGYADELTDDEDDEQGAVAAPPPGTLKQGRQIKKRN